MVMFKCPVCKNLHSIRNYEHEEYTCTNAVGKYKKSQNILKESELTSNIWNLNEWNTRQDTYLDLEILGIETMPSDKNKYAGGTKSHNW